jgi:hypothetical protein
VCVNTHIHIIVVFQFADKYSFSSQSCEILNVSVRYSLHIPRITQHSEAICLDVCSKRLIFKLRSDIELHAQSYALRSVARLHFEYHET